MEKFAFLDLLQALNGIGGDKSPSSAPKEQPSSAPAPSAYKPYNAMESVLSRHEQIASRLRNKK